MSCVICDTEEDKLRVSGGIRVVYVCKHVVLVAQYTFLWLEILPKCLILVCKGFLVRTVCISTDKLVQREEQLLPSLMT